MIYLTDTDIAALPEEPAPAFAEGERILRQRLEEALRTLGNDDSHTPFTLQYMNSVMVLARHYDIEELSHWIQTTPGKHDWSEYRDFTAEVDVVTMTLRLAHARRTKDYSVALNAATKQKMTHLVAQLRSAVEKLDWPTSKKDRLYRRINALQDEIDRERTGFHAFGALAIEIAADAGEAARQLEPVTRLVERIAQSLGVAKREEGPQPLIPVPPKRIEAPKKQKNGFERPLDDEMPF